MHPSSPQIRKNRKTNKHGQLMRHGLSRSFLVRAYPTMKAKNPQTPILIREALDVEPKVWARYEYGREKMIPLKGVFTVYSRSIVKNQMGVAKTTGI